MKHDCPALTNHVMATVTDEDFVDMTQEAELEQKLDAAEAEILEASEDRLAFCMDQVSTIENWCKAVRAAVYNRIASGEPVKGYKMVRGRKGQRKWTDEKEVEEVLVKSMKLKHDDAYVKKIISPTNALKLLKDSPKRMKRIEEFITQAEGSLSVAPQSDKRPEIILDVEFEDLSVEQETEGDLL